MPAELLSLLCSLPALLITLSVHELSHGLAAYKLGDPTAKNAGRLTLNPIKHFDLFGAVTMLLFRVGWAKPVPIDVRYFKNPKKGMALTALAGPLSNIFLGLIGVFLFAIVRPHLSVYEFGGGIYYHEDKIWQLVIYLMLRSFYLMNLSLAVFNLLPIPPLDGSRIFLSILPTKHYFGIMRYERAIMYGFFAYLIVCRYLNNRLSIDLNIISPLLNFVITWIENGMFFLVELLPFV